MVAWAADRAALVQHERKFFNIFKFRSFVPSIKIRADSEAGRGGSGFFGSLLD